MLREKIVASSATRMIAIGDSTKRVARLGAKPLPVEVLPFAEAFVAAGIGRLGGDCRVRRGTDGEFALTDQGNLIIDCSFEPFPDPVGLATALAAIPGLLGHGLFLDEIDTLYAANDEGVTRLDRAAPTMDRFP
jgi:ribose 5-phosphate isomerase A